MNLYEALHGIHAKIEDMTVKGRCAQTEKETMAAILENQVRLSESLLILGSLLHNIAGEGIEVEVVPPEGSSQH